MAADLIRVKTKLWISVKLNNKVVHLTCCWLPCNKFSLEFKGSLNVLVKSTWWTPFCWFAEFCILYILEVLRRVQRKWYWMSFEKCFYGHWGFHKTFLRPLRFSHNFWLKLFKCSMMAMRNIFKYEWTLLKDCVRCI